MINSYTIVETEESGGLPQLNVETYEEQLVWLFISFIALYFLVSRFALPKVTAVLEHRDELITNDLDTAEKLKQKSDTVLAAYEASLKSARQEAQELSIKTKEKVMLSHAGAQHKLDDELGAKADEAEARISSAVDDALSSLDTVANEVTSALVSKLSGTKANDKDVAAAVKASFSAMRRA